MKTSKQYFIHYCMPILSYGLLFTAYTYLPRAYGYSEKITICHDHYPPSEMHLSSTNNKRGFATDIISDIYQKYGYQISFFPATYVRSVKMTREGKCDIIAQVVPQSESDILYPNEVVFNYKVAFFVRAESDWVYNGVEYLKDQRVINITGFDYSDYPPMDDFIKDPKNNVYTLYGENAIERAIKMIAYHRADTISLNTMVAKYYINKLELQGRIKAAPIADPEMAKILDIGMPLSPGFSPKTKNVDKLIEIWDAERPKLDKNLNSYLSQYGISH